MAKARKYFDCILIFVYFFQYGEMALHKAARSDFEGKEKLSVLLKHGAAVNARYGAMVSTAVVTSLKDEE